MYHSSTDEARAEDEKKFLFVNFTHLLGDRVEFYGVSSSWEKKMCAN